ncbi:MAG: permease-like cell division protein FtsX [Peptococcaceae bacterium]|nr:permease-like cell division protein FtsX [Peptococcaceae bacterium]
MRLRTMERHLNEVLRSIWRNGWLSFASVVTVAISLFILGFTTLLVLNINSLAGNLESGVEMTVFLQNDASPGQIQALGNQLQALPGVTLVQFVSKEQALAQIRQNMGSQAGLLSGLGQDNPLPDAFQVKAVNAADIPALAGQVEGMAGVDQVRYGQGVVEKLLAVTHWLRVGGLVMMILVGISAVFLIATTIRVSVHARRYEIGIMKFLGATNWFVRGPFLMEGVTLGFAGSLLAGAVVYLGYSYMVDAVQTTLPFIQPVDASATLLAVVGGLLVLGVLIGAAGSLLSMRRYLRV